MSVEIAFQWSSLCLEHRFRYKPSARNQEPLGRIALSKQERVWVQKFEPENIFQFRAPSATPASALEGEKPVLYVRLSDDPTDGLT
jgi:hypothetical protein